MSIFDIFKKNNLKPTLSALKKNEIVITPRKNETQLRPDESKIGGKPFLPADFIWPRFTSKDDNVNRPLSFFCQINLSDVAFYDKDNLLPKSGMLYFFYECDSFCWGFDPDDKGAARVFYYENTNGFSLIDLPEDLEEGYIMPEIAVSFMTKSSYPRYEEFDCISDLKCEWEKYDSVIEKLGVDFDSDMYDHKLLGYADIIQSEMLSECERVTRGLFSGTVESYRNTPEDEACDIIEKAKDWTLLLQLGTISTDDFEWMFGDCGMLYFYIKKQDLLAKNFDNIWFSLQCG
ncbi:MAG: DUF1963 domain-containing protein [Clostridia bacterium]|nr:DUF1963 domain-containing protein [Clostridia bacterium]